MRQTILNFPSVNSVKKFNNLFSSCYNVFLGGDLPITKLAALQKVLQSDFLNAVREVYEHVYETVDIQVS